MKAILKCGERIRTDREGVWGLPQYGKIEFPISESLEILFAASYDSFAMHTGILLRNRKQGIRHELPYVKGGYRTKHSNLLIHMIERRNVVRVLFEMSDDDSKTLEEIGNGNNRNAQVRTFGICSKINRERAGEATLPLVESERRY